VSTHAEDAARTRLLEAAGEIFAEQGYESATIRDISARAGANVAAVNYYFRDKLGLYKAVIRESICALEMNLAPAPADHPTPEDAFRAFVAAMVRRVCRAGLDRQRDLDIMIHELAKPTAGLPVIVEESIAPRYSLLRAIISEIVHLPPDHDTVRLCAHSVIGQLVHYAHSRPVLAHVWPDMQFTPDQVDQIARHISEFSLAGLTSISAREPDPRS
jgi:AcrR family transcriptional regulator